MKTLTLLLAALLLNIAHASAAPSACVIIVETLGSTRVQQSCDGADISDLYPTVSGISTGISKSIVHFMSLGYAFNGCSDNSTTDNNSTSSTYSRCVFTKQ